jgi:predicted hydrocarbon binding protein
MVQVVATLSDEPGTLSALLGFLKTRVNLIGTISYSVGRNKAIFSGFGRVLSRGVTASSLQGEMRKLLGVRTPKVWESREGLLVDRYHVGFQTGIAEAYLIFPARALSRAFERIVRTFGSGGKTIVYEEGLDYAKARSGIYRKMMGPHPERRIDELTAIVSALGYGKSEASFDRSRRTLRLISRECFECSTKTETGRECEFLRGMAVGIFSDLFGRELVCEEERCRQRGDKMCVFALRTTSNRPLF